MNAAISHAKKRSMEQERSVAFDDSMEWRLSVDPMEIIGPKEGKYRKMSVVQAEEIGIQVRMDNSKKHLVYEIKVPLNQNEQTPYAIGTGPTGRIGIGFETGEIDMEAMMGKAHERLGTIGGGIDVPEGVGDPGGGMGRGPVGKGRRPMGPMIKTFEFWAKSTNGTWIIG